MADALAPPDFAGAGLAPADLAACRALLRGGSRSFHAASRLLPRRVGIAATALYAFCREADDAVDCAPSADARRRNLAVLEERLASAARGTPAPAPVDRALAWVLARHRIPAADVALLLEGLAWDSAGRRYDDLDGLRDYAMRVAGSVGLMMARIMGVEDPATLARAADLGIAMQFTNIARDVGEDARAGRLYLPLAWLRDAGIAPDDLLRRPRYEPAVASVVTRLLAEAETLYRRAEPAIDLLPADCRWAIRLAGRLYAAIGDVVATPGHDPMQSRAVVPPYRKLTLALAARSAEPGLPARVHGRALWVIDLFGRLQDRDAFERGMS